MREKIFMLNVCGSKMGRKLEHQHNSRLPLPQ